MSAQHESLRAQDLHGALLARLQPRAPAGGPDDVARLPVALREAAWVEAADCFAGMLPGAEARRTAELRRACITRALPTRLALAASYTGQICDTLWSAPGVLDI